jgi:hypothetical protein
VATRARPSNRRAFHPRASKALRSEGDLAPPEVLSVRLGEDEEVRWMWTHTVGAESVVTGYAIVEKEGDGGDSEAWRGAGEAGGQRTGALPRGSCSWSS